MTPFTTLTAISAPLPIMNVDTDMIIPKQFLKTIKRTGLGVNLFDEMRFTPEGKEVPDFVLNKEPYRNAGILVSGANFGCGSSREHAPWSLTDFGIRCIIAPSFADIFYNNCSKNGILPIALEEEKVAQLMAHASGDNPELSIDLKKQQITIPGTNHVFDFDIDANRKEHLLKGLDDIAITLGKVKNIEAFEVNDKKDRPWLYA